MIMRNKWLLGLVVLLLGAFSQDQQTQAATGEVTRSGSTWTGKVDGNTVYTGSLFFDAANACINNMSSGTVNIRNSGDSGPGIGNIYAIKPKSNITLDFHDHTVNCNGDAFIVPVQADNKSNITVRNLRVTGNPRYGIWFRTCSNISFDNITMNLTGGLGIRVDDSKGGWSTNLAIGTVDITGSGAHAVETYGVDGFMIESVTATDVETGCGLLLNNSRNGWVGEVIGVRCDEGGGYASFRCANNNGPNVTCDYVYARECGRGFFTVSGSTDCTVGYVDIADCTSHGIAIQDSTDTHVLAGTVSNCNPNTAIWGNSSGSTINLGGGGGGITGTKVLVNRASDRAMDVYNWNNSNGANIAIYDNWGGTPQQWIVTDIGGGLHSIRTVMSGNRSLDCWAFGAGNGTNVALYDYLGGSNQKFSITSVGSGYYRISPSHAPNQCLDAFGTSNGSNVGTWTYGGGNNQQWSFENP